MDKRVEKTTKKLTDALFELLKSKQISSITVSELCLKAGVNRRTFYIHYAKISDIFTDYRDSLANQVSRALAVKNVDAKHLLTVFDRILMSNFDGFRYLCITEAQHELVDELQGMLFSTLLDVLQVNEQNAEGNVIVEYIAYGVVNSYVFWFKHPELVDYHKLNQSNADIIAVNLELLRKTRMN